jgi:GNAT superfamily N-acetyltransferase
MLVGQQRPRDDAPHGRRLVSWTVRPATENDAKPVAALVNSEASEPSTPEQVRERFRTVPPGRLALRLVATRDGGELVGYGHALRDAWMEPGLFWLHVIVTPDLRRRGVGSQLYDELLRFTRMHDGSLLRGEVRDTDPQSLAFAEGLGGRIDRHTFESTLDLASFDEQPFTAALDRARASGIRFVTLADVPSEQADDAAHRLYDLQRTVARDIPGGSEVTTWPFEVFVERVLRSPIHPPDCLHVAADGDDWVGLASVERNPATNSMYNGLTGVLPSHRGRGIAIALKLLAIRTAQRYGAVYIRTNNDSQNAPILAVNRTFGYKPEPGYYRMIARLPN